MIHELRTYNVLPATPLMQTMEAQILVPTDCSPLR